MAIKDFAAEFDAQAGLTFGEYKTDDATDAAQSKAQGMCGTGYRCSGGGGMCGTGYQCSGG